MEKLKIAEQQHTSKNPDKVETTVICGKPYTKEEVVKMVRGFMKEYKKHYDYLKDR